MILGRFTSFILIGQTTHAASVHVTRYAQPSDLPRLTSLLSPRSDHAARIEAGDVCLWIAAEGGCPAAVAWVNLVSHADTYLGQWSRPSRDTCYLNQVFVAPQHRRRGLAGSLVAGALSAANQRGVAHLCLAVSDSEGPVSRIARANGMSNVGCVRGVRIGQRITLRYGHPEKLARDQNDNLREI